MYWRAIAYLIIVTSNAFGDPAEARQRHRIDATPFVHSPCGVLSEEPCTPSFCSVFGPSPCIPELPFPYSGDLSLTIESDPSADEASKYRRPDRDLSTLGDLYAALRACWVPPPVDDARTDMQISVRFSFKRSGQIIAPPRITFATSGVLQGARQTYFNSITGSLQGCTPLQLTGGLGGAIAGKPIAIRYVDNRKLQRQSGTP